MVTWKWHGPWEDNLPLQQVVESTSMYSGFRVDGTSSPHFACKRSRSLWASQTRDVVRRQVAGRGVKYGWMDGWMDGGREGGREEGMHGWMDGRMDGWMDGRIDGWMDGLIDTDK